MKPLDPTPLFYPKCLLQEWRDGLLRDVWMDMYPGLFCEEDGHHRTKSRMATALVIGSPPYIYIIASRTAPCLKGATLGRKTPPSVGRQKSLVRRGWRP